MDAESTPKRPRRRTFGGLAAMAAAVVAIVVVVSINPGGTNAANRSSTPSGSTTVQRRDLVSTDTESGTLGYANPQTVYDRLTGTITWLPSVGEVVRPGQTLFRVDGQPVILFDGTTPAYRKLTSGISNGPDVLELNADLVSMGFADGQIIVDDEWQQGTTDAIDRWQSSLGETETGSIALGRVVFLPGAQRITKVNTTLGSDGAPSSNGSGTGASYDTPAGTGHTEFVSLTTPTRPSSGSPSGPSCHRTKKHKCPRLSQSQLIARLIALLNAETRALTHGGSPSGGKGGNSPSSGNGASNPGAGSSKSGSGSGKSSGGSSSPSAGSSSTSPGSGGSGGSTQAVLSTTSNQLDVTVDLDATKQSEAVVGRAVTVQMPDGSTVGGKITAVSPVAQSSSANSGSGNSGSSPNGGSSGSGATVPVTVVLRGRVPATGLDQAAVSVNFEQQVANNVLSVPVTALLATQGGGYAVQEAAAPHKLIAVTPGLFAAGYVQVSGAGLYDGLAVTDSQG
jgi:hypothetical protein